MNTASKNTSSNDCAKPQASQPAVALLQQHHLAALVLEVSAPKAGNVHKNASFEDVTWLDFVASAVVTSPILARAGELGVGPCVYECVAATQQAVGSNTNLGMLLLLAPLSAAKDPQQSSAQAVLDNLDDHDAQLAFDAIALASPGGLGQVEQGDVTSPDDDEPALGLVEAMTLAAGRDLVARQYANSFADVYELAEQLTTMIQDASLSLDQAIVLAHLKQMASVPDTLIKRKLGQAIAEESAQRAQAVLDANWPHGENSQSLFVTLDRWLRADGHQRNPGTSADLVPAALFVVLRQGKLQLPHQWRENLWS